MDCQGQVFQTITNNRTTDSCQLTHYPCARLNRNPLILSWSEVMHLGILAKIFGKASNWHGPCLVILDADASVNSTGPDSIVSGGGKQYAPRIPSGRVSADAVCYAPDHHALLLIQRRIVRQQTGEDHVQESLMVVDVSHVVGLQFENTGVLDLLELPHPILPEKEEVCAGDIGGLNVTCQTRRLACSLHSSLRASSSPGWPPGPRTSP